ncbi:MAG: pantoate--beta-alanine ligase [Deltaproteobacteria bacterium]
MNVINIVEDMQSAARSLKIQGKSIVLVPTMGFLHEGHASLLHEGRRQGDILVLSIYVNPKQFGQNEDLERYPRDMEGDSRLATACGVDIIFAPDSAGMYPTGFQTSISLSKLPQHLCGTSRPGHFDGVATVVAKLFNICQPDVALFGKKDYQQLAVIKRMTSDLNLPVRIIGMPIVREPDGLAMSSRNSYLTPAERQSALCLYRAIGVARELYRSGVRDADTLRREAIQLINAEPAAKIDYIEFRNGETLEPLETTDDSTLMALAVMIGKTRLIDNTVLGEG